jgi:hypothetical protein
MSSSMSGCSQGSGASASAGFGRVGAYLRTLLAAVACLAGVGVLLGLAPEPDPIPRRWQLDVEVGPLRVASVDVPGVGPRSYYYLTYTVTNRSGQDLLFAPAWDLATDDGELIRSGRDVPASVTRELLDRLGDPLLQDQISILGMLLQGPENARDGLVIWPANDLGVAEIAIFGAGFSGETRNIRTLNARTGEPMTYTLRKTLMLRYRPSGDILTDRPDEVPQTERRWIMR